MKVRRKYEFYKRWWREKNSLSKDYLGFLSFEELEEIYLQQHYKHSVLGLNFKDTYYSLNKKFNGKRRVYRSTVLGAMKEMKEENIYGEHAILKEEGVLTKEEMIEFLLSLDFLYYFEYIKTED